MLRRSARTGPYLLTCLAAPDTPQGLSQLPAVAVLRQVWEQQFVVAADGQVQMRDPKALPPATAIVESPYEHEARVATKRGMHWVGYKVHVAETCDPEADLPHLVTQVETTPAPATDVNHLAVIQDALAHHGLRPSEHLVDAGSVRARNILTSRHRHASDLIGPVDAVHHWQAQVEGGFVATRFALDWDRLVAICPEGHTSLRWTESTGPQDRAMAHVSWDRQDCRHCPSRLRCTRAQGGARTLLLPPRAEFEALSAGRQRQTTDAFRQCYSQRAGIEGTIAQAVRVFGLRRARYRGLQKTRLQDVATAAALNVARIADWYAGRPRATTRVSRFARLTVA
jgi:transposase